MRARFQAVPAGRPGRSTAYARHTAVTIISRTHSLATIKCIENNDLTDKYGYTGDIRSKYRTTQSISPHFQYKCFDLRRSKEEKTKFEVKNFSQIWLSIQRIVRVQDMHNAFLHHMTQFSSCVGIGWRNFAHE